jgi:RimJ/RimL family protein N-acetyltransferase
MTELRPIRVEDLDVITAWKTDPTYGSEFQWLGFASTRRFREQVINDDVLTDDGGALAVVDGDELLGDISWRKQQTAASPASFCFNIGIVVRPEARGQGHGARAQRLLADYLFQHSTVNRVEASTDVDNLAEQKSLEKAGFTREGVLRGWQWRQGAWRDMVVYSRLRADG